MHKIVDNTGRRKSVLRVHCFPEIAQEKVSTQKEKGGHRAGSSFRRFDFSGEQGRAGAMDESIDAEVEARAREAEKQAFQKGYREGRQQGLSSGKQELVPIVDNFRQALSELEKVKKRIYESAERESVDLALAIARKIVCQEVKTNREALVEVVREAFRQAADQDRIRILLNPRDLERFQDPKIELGDMARGTASIVVEGDERISSGGCVIETDMGEIDARIEQRLAAVEAAIRTEMQLPPEAGSVL